MIIYFYKMPSEFIIRKQEGNTTARFPVPMRLNNRRAVSHRPADSERRDMNGHWPHQTSVCARWFVDWRASSKVCTPSNHSELIHRSSRTWSQEAGDGCYVTRPWRLKSVHIGTMKSKGCLYKGRNTQVHPLKSNSSYPLGRTRLFKFFSLTKFYIRGVVLNLRWLSPTRNIWKCLETIFIVATWGTWKGL